MIKKIGMWSIYAGVVGLLIFGAVIRTQAKAVDNNRAGSTIEGESSQPSSSDNIAPGKNVEGSGRSEEIFRNEEHDWIKLTGIVVNLDVQTLLIETDQGENLEFARRVWRFIQESGLDISIGDQVKLEGFYENGEFEISILENLTNGDSLQVREESGRPLWGGGQGVSY